MSKGASKQYRQSKELSRYKLLAQKLSQHLQNLAQDPNTRKRWLWELIQNAKDVPNQFDKVKIHVQIFDNELKFSHNGDPFRTSDLESIVSQYSSKPQQNKLDTETTGKYGTGFITTYILSRKLKIQGLLKISVPLNQSDSDSSDQEERQKRQTSKQEKTIIFGEESIIQKKEGQNDMSKEQSMVINLGSPREIIKSMELQKQLDDESDQQPAKKKPQIEKKEQVPMKDFFQKFKIRLDRAYSDRDTEFIQKLMKGQDKIIKKLDKLQRHEIWNRKVDDLDTSFVYEKLDKASFEIIQEGINTLKELFPYALVFNKKLYEIKVQDKRTERTIQNFTIQKAKYETIGVLNVGVCKIIDKDGQQIIRHLYKIQETSASTIAVPIEIQNKKIKLLAIRPGFPKIFKQFPLIGAQDTGYNYAFTSRKFYPNETRSNLMLKRIEGRNSKRTQSNWEVLQRIFETARTLFNMLPNFINQNQENFFLLKECQFLGNPQAYFENENKNFKERILSYKIIRNMNNKLVSIKDIVYFRDESKSQNRNHIQMSNKMNQLFKFLQPKDKQISDQLHRRLYERLLPHEWSNCVKYMNLEQCLNEIIRMEYKNLIKELGNRNEAYTLMEEIYKLLSEHAPQYLDFKGKYAKISIVLTNKFDFRSLSQLKSKFKMPIVYQNIAYLLGIDIESFLINDKNIEYFNNVPKFSSIDVEEKIHQFFGVQPSKDNISNQDLKLLIQFCKTLEIHKQITDIATEIAYFQDSIPFNVDITEFNKLDEKVILKYKGRLALYLLSYVQKEWFDNNYVNNLTNMIQKLNLGKKNPTIGAIKWFNKLLLLQNLWTTPQKIIKKSIAWDYSIYQINDLKYMLEYPDQQDVKFYEAMRPKWNNYELNKKTKWYSPATKQSLKTQLLHPQIEYKNQHKLVRYSQLFSIAMTNWNENLLNNSNKEYFLRYYNKILIENQKINSQYTQNKIGTFNSLRLSRHYEMLKLMNMDKREVDIIYNIATDYRAQLSDIMDVLTNYEISSVKDIMKQNSMLQTEQVEAEQEE